MPRPRLPDELLQLTGAWDKNPSRRRPPSAKSDSEFGDAPKYFSRDEKLVWNEIVRNCARGVLTGADRVVVEMLCLTVAKMRRREELSGSERTGMTFALGRLGMTPSDRSKIAAPSTPTKVSSPFDEFL